MKRSHRLTLILSGGVLAALIIMEAPHTRVVTIAPAVARETTAQLVAHADLVVQGTISKQLGTFRITGADGQDMVYTKWQLKPERALKGAAQAMTIAVPGGRYLTTDITMEDEPVFAAGDHVVLALKQFSGKPGYYRVVGEAQGAFRLNDATGNLTQYLSNTTERLQTVSQLIDTPSADTQ